MKNVEIQVLPPVQEITDEELQALILNQDTGNFFLQTALNAGVTDTPLKAYEKLETPDVLKRILHITCVHISHATLEDKEGGIDSSDYPVMTFKEFPGYRYSGGKRLMQVITTWAIALGDKFDLTMTEKDGFTFGGDRLLPVLNQYFSEGHIPTVYLKMKKGKRDYVDVTVLGI